MIKGSIDLDKRPVVKGHEVTRPNLKYGTSKWDVSIIDVYEILFDRYKNLPIKFLQIGVFHGECMRYFREFFTHPDALLVGVDQGGLKGGSEPGDNFIVETAKQQDSGKMTQIANKYGPFDIIIDDASHNIDPTTAAFDVLWPNLKTDGLYIIEDIGGAQEDGGMASQIHDLLTKLVVNHEGKGYISKSQGGFGVHADSSPLCILQKTEKPMTGLEI